MSNFLSKIKSFFKLKKKDIIILLPICSLIVFCDLITKHIAFSMKESWMYILPIFNILKVKNFGVSFGLFNENPEIMFYVIIVLDLAIMFYILHCFQTKKLYTHPTLFLVSLSFIIGGAIGNFVDRIFTGSVRDFLDFHIGASHWPCFNIADTFVCIGVGIWIICELFFKKKQ